MKNIKYFTYILLTLLLGFSTVNAQVTEHNTKIKDGSVSGTTSLPYANAVLELESTAKGFLLPRMSDAQRNQLTSKLNEDGNGLAIYNTTTDCINYWSKIQNEWLSLCGDLPPATVDLSASSCNKIKITPADGVSLVQGKFLTPQDILFVDFNVTSIGNYDISATTENGYYFAASGTFMNTGNMRIALQGVGTPLKGNATGDVVTFNINGKKATTQCGFKSVVKNAAIEYTLECTTGSMTPNGKYLIGVPVNQKDNYVEVLVTVAKPGAYSIRSTAFNGVSFYGSGVFDNAGGGQRVKLYAEGTPTKEGTASLSLTTNSNVGTTSNCKISLTVTPVDFKVDLSKATLKGVFKQGSKLTDQTITIPVAVVAPGTVNFKLESLGVVFSASNVRLELPQEASSSNIQYVTLMNNKAPLPITEANELVLSGPINDSKFTNTLKIPLEEAPVVFDIVCSGVSVNKNKAIYSPGIAMDSENYVIVIVNASSKGSYDLKTSEINGVSYSAKGVFEGRGTVEVKMYATGTPIDALSNVQYFISTNNSEGNNTPCSFKVSYNYYDINILVVGNRSYGPTKSTQFTAGKILGSLNNFGQSGKVKVSSINIYNIGSESNAASMKATLSNNKIDMVFVVSSGKVVGDAVNVLADFVKNEKGVVVYSNTYSIDPIKTFLGAVDPNLSNIIITNDRVGFNKMTNSATEIVSTDFGDVSGKYIGNEDNLGLYFSNVSDKVETLATHPTNSNLVWAGKHKELGLVFIGNGGWMIGKANDTNRSKNPSRSDAFGNPLPKYDFGNSERTGTVYNSLLFTNIMDWGIKYVLKNKVRD